MSNFPLLLELSLNNLRGNTQSAFPTRISNATGVKISNLQFIPSMTDDTMIVKANTKSDGPDYLTQIRFKTVPYLDKGDQRQGVSVTGVDANTYYFQPLTKNDAVEVNCTCKDFYYRFARYNYEKGALYGDEPERFEKHTNREPQNPRKLPALCKHLQRLFMELNSRKLMK